jgi:hypothetical protein
MVHLPWLNPLGSIMQTVSLGILKPQKSSNSFLSTQVPPVIVEKESLTLNTEWHKL